MGPNNKNYFSKHSLAPAADLYIHKTFFKDTRKYNKIAYLSQVPPQESAERGAPAAAANDEERALAHWPGESKVKPTRAQQEPTNNLT